jgi:hypothetical protein
MKRIACAALVLALAGTAAAQPGPQPRAARTIQHSVEFFSGEVPFDVNVIKGAPFSAEAHSQTIQTLADGNRIVRENSSVLYRDSEGRTRREHGINAIGNLPLGAENLRIISINDPVENVSYILHPAHNRATRISLPAGHLSEEGKMLFRRPGAEGEEERVVIRRRRPDPDMLGEAAPGGGPMIRHREVLPHIGIAPGPFSQRNSITEELGVQVIEGIQAEGRRTTITIPAGDIGNEQPIIIVSEVWISPELQLLVYSKRDDPMSGQTIYRLTRVDRSEPDASLFQVPAGYEVNEAPMIRRPFPR